MGSSDMNYALRRSCGRRLFLGVIAACLVAGSATATAQSYPSKPIKLIVGFAAGGATDIMARATAHLLGERLGQNILVENRTGAGGSIAVSGVTSAPADGYTLLYGTQGPLIINPRGEPLKRLTAVGFVGAMPLALVVRSDFPANTLSELVARAKAAPGGLTYASAGYGSITHIAMEMLKHEAKVDITHVPYKGQAAATPDVIAGRVDMLLDGWAPSLPNVMSGRLKYLAVTTPRRSAVQPQVPTVAEQGFPGFDAAPWYGVWVPAGTPPEIVAKLSAALTEVTKSQALQGRFSELGLDVMVGDADKLTRFTESERVRLGTIIKDANIRLE